LLYPISPPTECLRKKDDLGKVRRALWLCILKAFLYCGKSYEIHTGDVFHTDMRVGGWLWWNGDDVGGWLLRKEVGTWTCIKAILWICFCKLQLCTCQAFSVRDLWQHFG
jgi:hypothetical protein